jgi:hypothetical protein
MKPSVSEVLTFACHLKTDKHLAAATITNRLAAVGTCLGWLDIEFPMNCKAVKAFLKGIYKS